MANKLGQGEAAERSSELAEMARAFRDIAERLDELRDARTTRWTKPILSSHNLGVVKRRATLIKRRLGMKD
jgi:predicted ATPase